MRGRYSRPGWCEEDCEGGGAGLVVGAVYSHRDGGVVVFEARKVGVPEFS